MSLSTYFKEVGYNYPNNDIMTILGNETLCKAYCDQYYQCAGFVRRINKDICWIKGEMGNRSVSPYLYSYTKQLPQTSNLWSAFVPTTTSATLTNLTSSSASTPTANQSESLADLTSSFLDSIAPRNNSHSTNTPSATFTVTPAVPSLTQKALPVLPVIVTPPPKSSPTFLAPPNVADDSSSFSHPTTKIVIGCLSSFGVLSAIVFALRLKSAARTDPHHLEENPVPNIPHWLSSNGVNPEFPDVNAFNSKSMMYESNVAKPYQYDISASNSNSSGSVNSFISEDAYNYAANIPDSYSKTKAFNEGAEGLALVNDMTTICPTTDVPVLPEIFPSISDSIISHDYEYHSEGYIKGLGSFASGPVPVLPSILESNLSDDIFNEALESNGLNAQTSYIEVSKEDQDLLEIPLYDEMFNDKTWL